MKRLFKIGVFPIIIILSMLLFAAAPVLAEDPVEPQSPAHDIQVYPVDAHAFNDGTDTLDFWWRYYGWAGTADHHTFGIYPVDQPTSPFYVQSSDPPSSTFTTTIEPLQNINNLSGVNIYHPEWYWLPSDNHTWIVPEGFNEGTYWAIARLYNKQTGSIETAITTIYIDQAMGDLTVEKVEVGDADESWEFRIYGPDDPYSLYTSTTIVGDGSQTFNVPIGDYVVRETLLANWGCTPSLPDAGYYSDPDVVATVNFGAGTTVTFTNEPLVGTLVIHKSTDSIIDNDPADLVNWHFSVSPGGYSGDTLSNGTLTFSPIPAGTYTVTETLKGGWHSTDPGGITPQKTGQVVTVGQTTDVYFANQKLASLTLQKFNDLSDNGAWDAGEPELFDWQVTVKRGITTVHSGFMPKTLTGLVPGEYTATETMKSWWANTTLNPQTVTLNPGESKTIVFGNKEIPHLVPTLGQWGVIIMSGAFVGLLVWFGLRRRRIA